MIYYLKTGHVQSLMVKCRPNPQKFHTAPALFRSDLFLHKSNINYISHYSTQNYIFE